MVTLLLLLGCGSGAPTVDRAPPPPLGVNISASPLVEGWPATFDVDLVGVGPGVRVHLAGSSDRWFQSSCPPWLNGGCINVIDPFFIGSGVTDARGHARVGWVASEDVSGVLNVQALVLSQGFASSAFTFTLQGPRDDGDYDELSAEDEMRLGLDPTFADTDRGGTSDGQEVKIDLTDPQDRLDDLAGDRMCSAGDGDLDHLDDCGDIDCASVVACFEEDCHNFRDDDQDGLVDCADPHCAARPTCGEAVCDDRIDNDRDGRRDCADEDCWTPACHAEVVAWVDAGRATWRLVGAAPYLDHALTGRVWVGDAGGGARICSWYSTPTFLPVVEMEVFVDAHCRLNSDFLPTVPSLVIDPAAGLRTSAGALFLGPLVDFQPGDTVARVEDAIPSDPIGQCAGGVAPIRAYLDNDGDGYGVSDRVDLFGAPGGGVWVCDPNFPGVTNVGGDCHDGDPRHNPATVPLAAGVTCASLRFDDQDGDGALRGVDVDDRNARVQ